MIFKKLAHITNPLVIFLSRFFRRKPKVVLSLTYIFALVFGLVLSGFYPFVPRLTVCSNLFGEQFCTPTGFFIIMTASLPGYLIAGNILKFFPAVNTLLSSLLVFLVSFYFYRFFGIFIESMRDKERTRIQKIRLLILLFFLLLVFVVISLV